MRLKENKILNTRVYDAPVRLVWEAWTDLAHVEKWWGPRGFTLTTHSKELRPGGKWIYTMHGPDGTDYPNITTYHEVIPYEKLVYDHGGTPERDKLFTVTVTFKEEKGKTIMTMESTLPTEEAAREMMKFIRSANGTSTWDRLGEYLDHETTGQDTFLATRSFPADVETVFKAWMEVDGKRNFRKSTPPHLLQYEETFPAKNPVGWKLLATLDFTEEGENGARVRAKLELPPEATEAERQAFREMRSQIHEGWNASFEKLQARLGK